MAPEPVAVEMMMLTQRRGEKADITRFLVVT
jgi:hypothetical protein